MLAACILLLAVAAALTGRSGAQQPDWHCCTYTCYNPNAPAESRQAYYCHPTGTCPAQPADERSSSIICEQNGPAVKADTCQECVNRNH
jgi:hypothetical protein